MKNEKTFNFKDHAYPGRGGNHSPIGNVECLVRRAGSRGLRSFQGSDGKEFQLWLPNGDIEDVIQGGNIVTNRIKTQLSHLIVGHEATVRYANKMVWGTGGHAVGDPTTPIAPSETDTSLEAQVLVKNFSTFEFPSATSVRMIAFILEAEANGFTITEEGLVAADNTLVARRTFPGLPKTDDFVFEFRHTIIFILFLSFSLFFGRAATAADPPQRLGLAKTQTARQSQFATQVEQSVVLEHHQFHLGANNPQKTRQSFYQTFGRSPDSLKRHLCESKKFRLRCTQNLKVQSDQTLAAPSCLCLASLSERRELCGHFPGQFFSVLTPKRGPPIVTSYV